MRTDGTGPDAAAPLRTLRSGETIPAPVLADFLLACLRHDALADAALERLARLAKEGADDEVTTAAMARDLVEELLAAARPEDWLGVGAALRAAHEDASGKGVGGRRAHGPVAAPPGDGRAHP